MKIDSPEMRVAAAKDVLERLANRRNPLIADAGSYMKVSDGRVCQVCAVGGLFLGCIENSAFVRSREAKANDYVEGYEAMLESHRTDDVLMRQVIRQVFDERQLGLIEAAFEREMKGYFGDQEIDGRDASNIHAYGYEDELDEEDYQFFYKLRTAAEWGEQYRDDDERLEAIMKNIVANNGLFVLPA